MAGMGKNIEKATLREQDPKSRRLGIAHLFLWVTSSAILMAADRFWYTTSRYTSEQYMNVAPQLMALGTINGAAFGGLLLFASRRCRDNEFVREPGEWLLCGRGVYVAIWAAIYVLGAAAWRLSPGVPFVGHLVRYGGIAAAAAEPALFAALIFRQQRWSVWQITFSLLAALYCCRVWSAVDPWSWRTFYDIPMIGSSLTVIAASITEWGRSVNRPWTHWAGVSVSVGLGAVSAAFWASP